jgi:glucan biosynthesis protein
VTCYAARDSDARRPAADTRVFATRIVTKKEMAMAQAPVERLKRKLPERLAQIRGSRSQRQFARDLGVFQQNVNRYESGTTPHTDFLITLALKENVSIDWLLLGKGKMRRGR